MDRTRKLTLAAGRSTTLAVGGSALVRRDA
jgi:hypothetical protein